MKTFDKMKREDKDLETVLDWLEEFSTIKVGRIDSKSNFKLNQCY
jgi:hypothetical protein